MKEAGGIKNVGVPFIRRGQVRRLRHLKYVDLNVKKV